MTDSNIQNLLNNEEEEEKKKIETPETDALFERLDNEPLSSLSKTINKSNAGIVDFFDNRFLGDQRSFEEILENRSRLVNEAKETITAKNETELEIAKKQMDDEYDLRKDNLGKDMKKKFSDLEKLIIPLLVKLAKSPEAYIHWPNRAEVIEAQLKKIVAITRG